jgi:protein-S-isoprenylcysteine O-methyltransferase Ste14
VEKYVLLIAGWTMYFALHSILAADKTKVVFKIFLGKAFTGYRIAYNLISIIGLFLLLLLNGMNADYLLNTNNFTRYFSLMLATIGILILKAAFKQYQLRSFLGFKNDEYETFKAEGILKYVRHPLYSATILIVIGLWLFIPTLASFVSSCCIFIYLAIGIPLEERKLIKKYGVAYEDYKRNVPSLIPRLRLSMRAGRQG